jgi:hypothetical protein
MGVREKGKLRCDIKMKPVNTGFAGYGRPRLAGTLICFLYGSESHTDVRSRIYLKAWERCFFHAKREKRQSDPHLYVMNICLI